MKKFTSLHRIGVVATSCLLAWPAYALNDGSGNPQDQSIAYLKATSPHLVTGTVLQLNDASLTLQTRKGETVQVHIGEALKNFMVSGLTVGKPVIVRASSNDQGILTAISVSRAKLNPEGWLPDY